MKNNFLKQLSIGQAYENKLVETLNDLNIRAELNNNEDCKDIDIRLIDDKILIDSKLFATTFSNSFKTCGMLPENCMLINVNHVLKYASIEKERKKKVWIAFFVTLEDYEVEEIVFIPNSYLEYLIKNNEKLNLNNLIFKTKSGIMKLRVDRKKCRSLKEFKKYILKLRKIEDMRCR